MKRQLDENRLVDVYVHNRLDEIIISRKNTQEEINQRTKNLALNRLQKNNPSQ